MTSTSSRLGFTLVELLVVIGMIAVIMGALTTSVAAAQERARIQKATAEVKVITQAILAYENYARGGRYELPEMKDVPADRASLGFLLGNSESADSGGQIPALLLASLSAGGQMRDPWGMPYRVTVKKYQANIDGSSVSRTYRTGYSLPNLYRLSEEERR